MRHPSPAFPGQSAGLLAFLGRQDDEALELAVLADLLVNLLDQTGQGLGGLAGEDADHRADPYLQR